jgi:hypothetical protein
MSVFLVFACLAAGSVGGMVVFGVVLVCCVGLFLVGYQRDQRAE